MGEYKLIYPKCSLCEQEQIGDDKLYDLHDLGLPMIVCEDCMEGLRTWAEDLTEEVLIRR